MGKKKFTMDDEMSESVIQVFIDMYNKGLIYRGVRMVNWDPKAKQLYQMKKLYIKKLIQNYTTFHTKLKIKWKN